MTIEEKLRLYIVDKYCSIANFCNKIEILPQTMSAIFKRGITTCSAGTLSKICDELEISMDLLFKGEIAPKELIVSKEYTEFDYIFDYILIDGEPLGDYEKTRMKRAFHNAIAEIRETREMFKPDLVYIETPDGEQIAIDKKKNQSFYYVAPDGTHIPFRELKYANKIIEEYKKRKENE